MFTALQSRAFCISFLTKGKCAFNVCPQYLIFLSLGALVMFWLEKNTTLSHKLWKKDSEFISFFGPDIYCQLLDIFHSPFFEMECCGEFIKWNRHLDFSRDKNMAVSLVLFSFLNAFRLSKQTQINKKILQRRLERNWVVFCKYKYKKIHLLPIFFRPSFV